MGIAIITMAGMNRAYEIEYGDTIFAGSNIPEGIDTEILFKRILYRCGEFSVMHADIDFMHDEILNFFDTHYRTFDKWIKALEIEYAPLENYNRTELFMGGNSHADSNSSSSSGTSSTTNDHQKAAYNSSSYEPYEKDIGSGSDSSSLSGSSSGSFNEQHTLKAYGNIGVTTSQEMLQSELDIALFNIYTKIADMFAGEFTMMVY